MLIIDIPLTQGHLLQIAPVDRGPGGLPEFFTFMPRPKQSNGRVPFQKPELEKVETVRVHVALFDTKDGNKNLVFSHTFHSDSLEKVIKTALKDNFRQKIF